MARLIETLSNEELELVTDYQELYGLDTLEEALDIAIAEGSIDNGEGGGRAFLPEDFRPMRLFTGHQKAKETKVNKALKKARMDTLFEDDIFYLGSELPKDDKGEFILEECKTTACGEKPTIVVLQIKYKAVRAAFDGAGQPEDSNFDSTLADSIFPSGQAQMSTKFGNAADIISGLKKEYHDGKMGKTQGNVPDKFKVKFKVVLFCMVKTDNGWEKAAVELSNRYEDSQNLVTEWNKRPTGIASRLVNTLEVTGEDNFDNPVIQILLNGSLSKADEASIKEDRADATRAIGKFMKDQQAQAKSEVIAQAPRVETEDSGDEDSVPEFVK